MTENDIQRLLWRRWIRLKGRTVVVAIPCSQMLGWEADMIAVTRSLLCHEFEIKVDRRDFLADMEKEKWWHYQMWVDGKREYAHPTWPNYMLKVLRPANYFWYVCPPEIASADEMKDGHGLIHVVDGHIKVVVEAKRIHKEKLGEKELVQMLSSLNWKYWNINGWAEHKLKEGK
jgi:hypothetical protein